MEALFVFGANNDVVLLSQSWLCQCYCCLLCLMVVIKIDQHERRKGRAELFGPIDPEGQIRSSAPTAGIPLGKKRVIFG